MRRAAAVLIVPRCIGPRPRRRVVTMTTTWPDSHFLCLQSRDSHRRTAGWDRDETGRGWHHDCGGGGGSSDRRWWCSRVPAVAPSPTPVHGSLPVPRGMAPRSSRRRTGGSGMAGGRHSSSSSSTTFGVRRPNTVLETATLDDDASGTSSVDHGNDDAIVTTSGVHAWECYQHAQQQDQLERAARDGEKSLALYREWEAQRARLEPTPSPSMGEDDGAPLAATPPSRRHRTAAGVKVVQTLARQARDERDRESSASSSPSLWSQRAAHFLQQAADHWHHPPALLVQGNHALERAQQLWSASASVVARKQTKTTTMHDFTGGGTTATSTPVTRPPVGVYEALQLAQANYQAAGERGAGEAWFNLGHLLWTGFPDQTTTTTEPSDPDGFGGVVVLPRDTRAAMDAFRHATKLGDADAMYFVGVINLSSSSDDDNDDDFLRALVLDKHASSSSSADRHHPPHLETVWREGLALIERAAAAGHGGAMHYLALLSLNGHDGLQLPPNDLDHFVTRLDQAAAFDDPDALFLRGHCFFHGEHGYPLNYRHACRDFVHAAALDHADAAVSAGAILHRGYPGVDRDQPKAFEWYQRAGELGNMDGWRNVVACYWTGEGVPKSEEIAKYIAKTMLKE